VKFTRIVVFIALVCLLVSMITGCSQEFQPATYTDDIGREINIEEVPERIIAFGPSITEILFELGLDENIVGVSDFCDYPEEAQLKPKVGNAFSPSMETIVELEPDLVITVKQAQFNQDMDSLRIKYVVLDPKTVSDIMGSIELVGQVTDKQEEASELANRMQAVIDDIVDGVKNTSMPKVFFIVDATDPTSPWTAGSGSFINDLITMAGGENIAADGLEGWTQMSIEGIVSAEPDIIIVQTMMGGIPTISKENF